MIGIRQFRAQRFCRRQDGAVAPQHASEHGDRIALQLQVARIGRVGSSLPVIGARSGCGDVAGVFLGQAAARVSSGAGREPGWASAQPG